MKKMSVTLLGSMVTFGAFLATGSGCGDSSNGGGSGGGTMATSATSSGTTSASSSGTGGPAATCDAYCTTVMANCTADNAQYTSKDDCLKVCAEFPAGKAGDASGDSLACRTVHAGKAAGAGATTHCPHAGPGGGDGDPSDATGPVCGEGCEAFCEIAGAICQGTYTDTAACMADCKTFNPSKKPYSTADTGTNDFNCRLYHLTQAAHAPATHCPHIVAASPVCKAAP
jgi:hypothetical protein